MADLMGDCIEEIRKWVRLIARSDQELREIQTAEAPKPSYFDQRTVASPTIYKITEAQGGTEKFSTLVITFESTSGVMRFRVDNTDASPTVGNQFPAGAGTLTINGHDQIKGFSMVAEAANLVFARQLYK